MWVIEITHLPTGRRVQTEYTGQPAFASDVLRAAFRRAVREWGAETRLVDLDINVY